LEKTFQLFDASAFEHPTLNLNRSSCSWKVCQIDQARCASCLVIIGSEHEFGDPGANDGACAHGAGLEGDVESGVWKAPVSCPASASADGDDLGVLERGSYGAARVAGLAQNLPVRVHQDRSDGRLAPLESLRGQVQGSLHPLLISERCVMKLFAPQLSSR
jgi:hypothetical protein